MCIFFTHIKGAGSVFYGAISALLKQPLQLCIQTVKQIITTVSEFVFPLKGTRTSDAAVNYAPLASSLCTKEQFTIMCLCCCMHISHVCLCVCEEDYRIFWEIWLDPTSPSSSVRLDSLVVSYKSILSAARYSLFILSLWLQEGSFVERKGNYPGV